MDGLTGFMAVGTGWVAILMPVFITWVILYYGAKMDKDKYSAMVEISKSLENPSDIEDLLENLKAIAEILINDESNRQSKIDSLISKFELE